MLLSTDLGSQAAVMGQNLSDSHYHEHSELTRLPAVAIIMHGGANIYAGGQRELPNSVPGFGGHASLAGYEPSPHHCNTV